MTKEEQFLWIVQTMVLAKVASLPREITASARQRKESSSDAAFVAMVEAVGVSRNIPDTLSVTDAAHEFCAYVLQNLREEGEETLGHPVPAPNWMAPAGGGRELP